MVADDLAKYAMVVENGDATTTVEEAVIEAAATEEAEAVAPEEAATTSGMAAGGEREALVTPSPWSSRRRGGGGGGIARGGGGSIAVAPLMSLAAAPATATLAAVAATTMAGHLGRARICSSRDGVAFCLNVSRSLLLTKPEPTTTIFEARLMLYGTPSGSTMPVSDTAFLGGMSRFPCAIVFTR
jgi:hypothetical protein